MQLKERPLIELRFAKVSKPYLIVKQGKIIAIFPIAKREDHLEIMAKLVRLRDLLCPLGAQEPEKN